MAMMMVQLRLDGCRVLVAGAGAAAALKLRALKRAGALPRVVAPDVGPAVLRLLRAWPGAEVRRRRVRAADLAGCWLAVSATGDPAADAALARAAERRRIPLLNAGRVAGGRLGFAAQASAGRLRVAVTTGGADPRLAVRLAREAAAAFRARGPRPPLGARTRA